MAGGGGGGKMGGGGGKGGGGVGGDMQAALAAGSQRIQQNYSDLGLGPAGSNWAQTQGMPAVANASPAFPSGTPFAGQTPGFPSGTAAGTLPTATQTDLSNWNTQVGAGFAPLVDAQNQLNQQAQQNAAGALGSLAGLGGGLGGGSTGGSGLGLG